MSGQISLKDRFNSYLSAAIRDVPVTDRIILDTGDGAAINFLGDVEDALKAALSLSKSLIAEESEAEPPLPPLQVRMGINLGPVRLVRDINGQPNIVGDGINVAQRIMGFANTKQILVSRSYYEAVSRLSHEYVGMFSSLGARTDKHVREHEIFAINFPGAIAEPQADGALEKAGKKAEMFAKIQGSWGAAQKWMDEGVRGFAQASIRQRALFAGIWVAPFLLLIVVYMIARLFVAPSPQTEAVPTVAAVTATPAAPETAAKPPPKPEAIKPVSSMPTPAPAAHDKPGKEMSVAKLRTHEEVNAESPAIVSIAVTPWGEVYLDDRMKGVSPPLAELKVAPGKHKIEIRNTTFTSFKQSINVKAGEKVKIKHKFTN